MHEVKLVFKGKRWFFDVISAKSGKEYKTSVQFNCDCRYYSVQGAYHNKPCSHIIDVLKNIINEFDGVKNE